MKACSRKNSNWMVKRSNPFPRKNKKQTYYSHKKIIFFVICRCWVDVKSVWGWSWRRRPSGIGCSSSGLKMAADPWRRTGTCSWRRGGHSRPTTRRRSPSISSPTKRYLTADSASFGMWWIRWSFPFHFFYLSFPFSFHLSLSFITPLFLCLFLFIFLHFFLHKFSNKIDGIFMSVKFIYCTLLYEIQL